MILPRIIFAKNIYRLINVLATVLSSTTSIIFVITTFDYINIWEVGSIFYGASYLPPIWLLFPVIITSGLFFFLKKKTRAVMLIVFYIIYFFAFGDYSFKAFSSKMPIIDNTKSITVLSINVKYYEFGFDKIMSFIDSVSADVVFLCENTLDRDTLVNSEILRGEYDVFTGKKYETAILSRYPFQFAEEIALPTHQASLSGGNIIDSLVNNPKRSFVHAKIMFDNRPVSLISIRLLAGRPMTKRLKDQIEWGKYLAEKQIEEVNFFTTYLKNIREPVIFGGDLNAPPNSRIISELNKYAKDAALEVAFYPTATFRRELPVLRLDYLYSTEGLNAVKYCKLKDKISDHYPIYAEFVLQQIMIASLRNNISSLF